MLRGPLGLTGTHFGCGANQCGACNVLVDGQAVASCDTPLWAAAGKDITTVEGLGTPERAHPLQRAFIAEQAMQCGYCISGILISAAALLRRNPNPSEAEVRARARPQFMSLRRAQSHCPRRVARGQGRGHRMSTGPGLGYHIVDGGGTQLPGSLRTNPRLSQWLRLRADGVVEVLSGKVEIGQGILTAIAQIVADELDVDLGRVRMVAASTASSPNEGVTSGSLSIEQSGSALRYACAEARAIYLEAAAQRLGVAAQSLQVRDGTIVGLAISASAIGSLPATIC